MYPDDAVRLGSISELCLDLNWSPNLPRKESVITISGFQDRQARISVRLIQTSAISGSGAIRAIRRSFIAGHPAGGELYRTASAELLQAEGRAGRGSIRPGRRERAIAGTAWDPRVIKPVEEEGWLFTFSPAPRLMPRAIVAPQTRPQRIRFWYNFMNIPTFGKFGIDPKSAHKGQEQFFRLRYPRTVPSLYHLSDTKIRQMTRLQ
jgi:hypothetical protein